MICLILDNIATNLYKDNFSLLHQNDEEMCNTIGINLTLFLTLNCFKKIENNKNYWSWIS